MLKELRLSHWKSFDQATLYIDSLIILIGTNASGKSNTLDALQFLQRVASGVSIFQAINGDVNLPQIRGGMEWVCRKPAREFTLTLTLGGETEQQDYRYSLSVQVNGAKAEVSGEELVLLKYGSRSQTAKESRLFYTQPQEANTPGIPAYFSTGTKGPGRRIDVSRSHCVLAQADALNLRKEVQEGVKRVLSCLQQIFVFDPIPSHMRDYKPFSDQLQADGSNIAGVLAALAPERKVEVEATLTSYLKALPERDIQRVWTEPVGKFQTDAMLYCQEGWMGYQDGETDSAAHTVDARGMSDGTLRYLAIVTAMLTRQPGSLLVIEEVDNGLHPSRATVLVEMLRTLGKERGIDVVITTHNPALLDAAGAAMVPFITVVHRDNTTGASLLTLLEDIQQLPKLMAAGSLGRLSSEGRIEAALKQESPQ
ncbi:MAG: AAA family ATPase [Gammaproteobacteria bacterium]|nr:AAA family ATPase [Gammaproteobacteria bacterium]